MLVVVGRCCFSMYLYTYTVGAAVAADVGAAVDVDVDIDIVDDVLVNDAQKLVSILQ